MMIKVTVFAEGFSPQEFICAYFFINQFGYLVIKGLDDFNGFPTDIAVFKEFHNIVSFGEVDLSEAALQ